jgi:hypothetical protein
MLVDTGRRNKAYAIYCAAGKFFMKTSGKNIIIDSGENNV